MLFVGLKDIFQWHLLTKTLKKDSLSSELEMYITIVYI